MTIPELPAAARGNGPAVPGTAPDDLHAHALAAGVVHTTADRAGVALWIPAGEQLPGPPAGYPERLTAVTRPWSRRFLAFDATLARHHLAGIPHHHLAILAVRPDRQRCGIGTGLLTAHHRTPGQAGTAAYLEASSQDSRRLYLRHGYQLRPGGPFCLPEGGPPMWPMTRQPGRPGAGA